MAGYNPYYPGGYAGAYPNYGYQQPYQQYQQPYQQPVMQAQQQGNAQPQIQTQGNQPQIQNGGFIGVRSREEAFNYPVAPGTSVTFKNENAPYVYTKTKGFSQLEQPVFETYKLVKEEPASMHEEKREKDEDAPEYALKKDLQELFNGLDNLRQEVEALKKSAKKEAKVIKPVEIKEESEKVEVEA